MKSSNGRTLSNLVFKINVGFLLADGPGNSQNSNFDIPDPVRVSSDLVVNNVTGNLRLSRMKEGILAQGNLTMAMQAECTRCTELIEKRYTVNLEELYGYLRPVGESEFYIGADGMLDLGPLIRAEMLIQLSQKILCDEDYQDRCPYYGVNMTYVIGAEDVESIIEDEIDPRLAKLKSLLNKK